MDRGKKTIDELAHENAELRARLLEESEAAEEFRARLAEAEVALDSIRNGEADGLPISAAESERIYTLEGADTAYRNLVENIQQGAATMFMDGTIFYSNQHLVRILKTPLQQFIGASIHNFVHPADEPLFNTLVDQARKGSSEGELRFQTADGHLMPVSLVFIRLQLGERWGLCLVVTDLTTIGTAEKLARAKEQMQREITVHKWAGDLLSDRLPELLETASHQSLEELITELMTYQIELQMQNDELRQTQQQLDTTRKRYLDLYDFAPVSYFSFDQRGKIMEANLAGARMLGVGRGRLIGMSFSSFCTAESADQFYLHQKRVFKCRESDRCELTLKISGTELETQIESIAVQDDDGSYSFCQSAIYRHDQAPTGLRRHNASRSRRHARNEKRVNCTSNGFSWNLLIKSREIKAK